MKIKIKSVLNIVVTISAMTFTGLMSMTYEGMPYIKVVSMIIAGVIVYYGLAKYALVNKYAIGNRYQIYVSSFIISFFSILIIANNYENKWNRVAENFNIGLSTSDSFVVVMMIASIFVYFSYLVYFSFWKRHIWEGLIKTMSHEEKVFFFTFTMLMTFVIAKAHFGSSAFDLMAYKNEMGVVTYVPYDAIMDCDSPYVQYSIHSFGYSFRHPIWAFVALPEYTLAKMISILSIRHDATIMFIFSIQQMFKLALAGLCLYRITKCKWTLPIWFTSYPVIMYSIVIERHSWMAFWNILLCYLIFEGRKKEVDKFIPIVQAGGANLIGVMITPVLLTELKIKDFAKKAIELAIYFIGSIIITGNLAGILNIASDVQANNSSFVEHSDLISNLKAFSIAIKSCFGGVKLIINDYTTRYDESGFSIFGIIIITICLMIIIYNRDKKSIFMGYWIVISIILFPLVGFSRWDFSMHMILFSWAYIGLIMLAVDRISIKSKMWRLSIDAALSILLLWQVWSNITVIYKLFLFAQRFNYIQ